MLTTLAIVKLKSEKISVLNGIQTHDLRDARTGLYQLGAGHFVATMAQSGKPSVGLIAQLVEHCTGIAEVMGLNLIQA